MVTLSDCCTFLLPQTWQSLTTSIRYRRVPAIRYLSELELVPIQEAEKYDSRNKCIGDDTKAAAHKSLNCIKTKKNKIWRKTIFNMADGILTPCNVARSRH